MEPLAQLEGKRTWLEAELLAIERAIDDQRQNPIPGTPDDQGEVIGLLTCQLEEHLAQLRTVNEQLAQMRQ